MVMIGRRAIVVLAVVLWLPTAMSAVEAQSSGVDIQRGVPYAEHDGVTLLGDLYSPKAPGKYPSLVAVHGGAFQVGSSVLYRDWGPYLAERGYVVFAIDYRLVRDGKKMYPEAIQDVRAAVQFLRSRGEAMKVDGTRIGLMGDSAGAYLSAMVALAGGQPIFAGAYKTDPYAGVSSRVKICVGIYGIYDLTAAWHSDLAQRPYDRPSEKFLGEALIENRKLYFEASPMSYVTVGRPISSPASGAEVNQPAFLLSWGTQDDIVTTQAQPFLLALKQAGFFVRTVIVQGAPHFWISDPLDEAGSFSGFFAPRLVRFLRTQL